MTGSGLNPNMSHIGTHSTSHGRVIAEEQQRVYPVQ